MRQIVAGFWNGYSAKEIGRELGISEQRVNADLAELRDTYRTNKETL